MTRSASSQPAPAVDARRARRVSGATFGLTAALVSLALLGAGWASAPDRGLDWTAAFVPLAWAAPAALVAALAGRRLAAMPTAGGGGFVGAGVTFGAALLLLVGLYAVAALAEPSRAGVVLSELRVPLVWWLTLGGAALLSPVGALAGWLAWRRIHRGGAAR